MLVGLLSRWCFLIGGHGRRQWAGQTGDFGGLRKIKSKFVQADEKLVCYWSSGVGERELYSLRLLSIRCSSQGAVLSLAVCRRSMVIDGVASGVKRLSGGVTSSRRGVGCQS
ncbi:hypothetical protein TNCV_641691 [Trichonephila clavipes]|nr:hypothetical protein TNCV_641691 [Trichonephila clavipes]